jgi:5-formyltetrahydrofolate cyclo-ligase
MLCRMSWTLIKLIWQQNKCCYLPILTKEKTLLFVRYSPGDELEPNRYGIPEPVNKIQQIAPQALDLVILPLLAFDNAGHRLGTGGGYYDRTFAFLNQNKKNNIKCPLLLGLAYASQQAIALPVDAWDIPLKACLTF